MLESALKSLRMLELITYDVDLLISNSASIVEGIFA
jgi:hypothetical protein